ncbi:unnamed protein product, partial [Allacma fusca]
AYKQNDGNHNMILTAATLACEKLNKYYPTSDGLVYVMGIVLDPRCKLKWHKTMKFADSVLKANRQMVVNHWKLFYKSTIQPESVVPTSNDIIQSQMSLHKSGNKDELDQYLSEALVKFTSGEDVLTWWKIHETDYPNLSRMARDFLGAAATGVPAECMFSMDREEFLKGKSAAVVSRILGEA